MRRLLPVLLLLALAGPAAAREQVREERTVQVHGVSEVWRLVWSSQPRPICGPEEVELSMTCPCAGLAYGEVGNLSLVRIRGGREIERLRFGRLYGGFDGPSLEEGLAALQRWPMYDRDWQRDSDDPQLASKAMRRKPVQIMRLADYDHDGRATEFLFQVGTMPCGKRQFVAIGVSTSNPKLHALTTGARTGKPLAMPGWVWSALLRSPRPPPVTTWQCGDHGSEVRSEVTVSADRGRIRAVGRDFSCPVDGGRERLVDIQVW